MNTVGQLQRWFRDSGITEQVPIVVQAFGKSVAHEHWTVQLVGGRVVIVADLAPRRRGSRCPVCDGTEFEMTLDNDGETYSGCKTCVIGPPSMAEKEAKA